MNVIKLDATPSTNAYLKDLWQNGQAEDETVIWATHQFGGRGQQGTVWQSEAGKNLTFSVLKRFEGLEARAQFALNMAVSLAVYKALVALQIPDIRLKWPNDILSCKKKICGILIENIVKAKEIKASVIGIGLNVNQLNFEDIGNASSLKSITGRYYDLDEVLNLLLNSLQSSLVALHTVKNTALKAAYEEVLYRNQIPSDFKLADGIMLRGIILGISDEGQLNVEIEGVKHLFSMKEIQLLN